jgi:polyvinyl alcohol dehydrogenase (cytochrome)
MPRSRLVVRFAVLAVVSLGLTGYSCQQQGAQTGTGQWLFWGGNLHNTHNAEAEKKITGASVWSLQPKWSFDTLGNVHGVPMVKDGRVYFMDAGLPLLPGPPGGKLRVVEAATGHEIWSRSIFDYSKSLIHNVARTTPVLAGDLLIFGDGRNQPSSLLDIGTGGATLYAVNKDTGELAWKTTLDPHPLAVVTQSPVVYNGRIYIGVSSQEEGAARLGYPCCTFRGSMLAVDAATGRIVWRSFMVPDNFGQTGHYAGAAVWGSSPSIDEERHVVYVATGNNYSLPDALEKCLGDHLGDPATQQTLCFDPLDAKDNFAFSVLALDLDTGATRWARKLQNYGSWTLACDTKFAPWLPANKGNCRDLDGADFDFGQAPMLYTVRAGSAGRDLIATGQKSGVFWAFDPDHDGATVWATTVGPGGDLGGMEFGSATDGERIYTQLTNFGHTPFQLTAGAHAGETTDGGIWAALDAATGQLLWQLPDPSSTRPKTGLLIHPYWGTGLGPGFFAADMGPLSVANGLVFAGSMDPEGHVYAIDGKSGEIRWSYATGASIMSAPAIVDGVLYWGSGYDKGTNGHKLFAFAPTN